MEQAVLSRCPKCGNYAAHAKEPDVLWCCSTKPEILRHVGKSFLNTLTHLCISLNILDRLEKAQHMTGVEIVNEIAADSDKFVPHWAYVYGYHKGTKEALERIL